MRWAWFQSRSMTVVTNTNQTRTERNVENEPLISDASPYVPALSEASQSNNNYWHSVPTRCVTGTYLCERETPDVWIVSRWSRLLTAGRYYPRAVGKGHRRAVRPAGSQVAASFMFWVMSHFDDTAWSNQAQVEECVTCAFSHFISI